MNLPSVQSAEQRDLRVVKLKKIVQDQLDLLLDAKTLLETIEQEGQCSLDLLIRIRKFQQNFNFKGMA